MYPLVRLKYYIIVIYSYLLDMNYYTYLAFVIAFLWGISPVLFKYILSKNIPPYIIILTQASVYFLTSIIYIIVYERNNIYGDIQKNSKYIPFLIVISFFSVYVANVLYIFALDNKANVNIMSLIVSLAPVITLIASFLILQEILPIKVLIGFLIIFIGLLFIFLPF
jgi:drug/metabolite transporter (DMT)-like permease